MQLTWISRPLTELRTEALVVPLLADVPPQRIRDFDPELAELIIRLNHHRDWKGEPNEAVIFYPDHTGGPAAERLPGIKRVVLVGMGKKADWTYEKMRTAVAAAVQTLKHRKIEAFTVLVPRTSSPTTVRDLATIVLLASYDFAHYKTVDKEKVINFTSVSFIGSSGNDKEYEDSLKAALIVGQATNYVRDLVNHPANVMTPLHLAKDAKELADDQIKVTSFGRKELEKLGMGGLLAVGKGSVEEPQLIVVDYSPQLQKTENRKQRTDKVPTIGLVGKGITFDSGGISIKPSEGMEEMKMDMAGAATCLGVIAAARGLNLPVRIVAVLPTTENVPSGSATKPGDIVKTYDGKTIEIVNTDAEGRVVLADGLSYMVKNYQPAAIIDLATLTGAAVIALGHEASPMLGNNQPLMERLAEAAHRTGERVWQLPLWDEYKEAIKSEVADVKNIGEARKAGVISGAAFLAHFVPKDIPWAHLDIAGTAMMDKPRRPYLPKGGTGWGVRLLIDLLEHWEE